jgi:hypothetical protein
MVDMNSKRFSCTHIFSYTKRMSKRIAPLGITVLFGVYPVLSYFSHNAYELKLFMLTLPIILSIGLSIVLYILFYVLSKKTFIASIFSSIALLFFYSYGHVFGLISSGFSFDEHIFLILYFVLFGICELMAFTVLKKKKRTRVLFQFISVSIIAINIFLCIKIFMSPAVSGWNTESAVKVEKNTQSLSSSPDIFFFDFDRYASNRSLKSFYSYDNEDQLSWLRSKGFLTTENDFSNYPTTDLSLASILNMEYLDDMVAEAGGEKTMYYTYDPIYKRLNYHAVATFLKSHGYMYIHIGSDWHGTRSNPYADINHSAGEIDVLSSFGTKFIGTTLLTPFFPNGVSNIPFLSLMDEREVTRKLRLEKFETLKNLPTTNTPRFVFAHILMPHPRYVFDENGGPVSRDMEMKVDNRELYIGQLKYTNKLIRDAIDTLLVQTQGKAIIIIQSEEGPYPWTGPEFDQNDWPWNAATNEELRVKLGIFSAFYLPGVGKEKFDTTKSPVNTFRQVFNIYFGENNPMLPLKYYRIPNNYLPYQHIDITDIINEGK